MTSDSLDEPTAAGVQTERREAVAPRDVGPPELVRVVAHWPWLLAAAISVALIMFGYYGADLFEWWWLKWMEKDSYYSHGILVPLISAFAVYLDRRALARLPVVPNMLGLLVLLPAMIGAAIARSADTPSILGLTLPAVLFGAVLTALGLRIAVRLVFPIGFLFFMCVLPGFILTLLSFRIQLMSTSGAALLLKIAGLDPQQSGAAINLPNAQVLVGQPCSGFRLLISLMAFAIFFAYMREGPRWGKLVMVAATAPLSLVVNSIRIALVAVVGEFFGNEAMHAFHDYSGYLVLVLAFLILWQISKVVKCQKFKAVLTS